MEVYLHKDVPNLGSAGQIVRVKPGFAQNYIIPRGLGSIVTEANRAFFKTRERKPKDTQIATQETSLLADKISSLRIILKRKMHDDGKLYAAVRPGEVADLLTEKVVKID